MRIFRLDCMDEYLALVDATVMLVKKSSLVKGDIIWVIAGQVYLHV